MLLLKEYDDIAQGNNNRIATQLGTNYKFMIDGIILGVNNSNQSDIRLELEVQRLKQDLEIQENMNIENTKKYEEREKQGIKYINDTTATTPDATIAALKAKKQETPSTSLDFARDRSLEINKFISKSLIFNNFAGHVL